MFQAEKTISFQYLSILIGVAFDNPVVTPITFTRRAVAWHFLLLWKWRAEIRVRMQIFLSLTMLQPNELATSNGFSCHTGSSACFCFFKRPNRVVAVSCTNWGHNLLSRALSEINVLGVKKVARALVLQSDTGRTSNYWICNLSPDLLSVMLSCCSDCKKQESHVH